MGSSRLSPLFYAIQTLPLLSTLTLAIPVQPPHLGNAAAIAALLQRYQHSLQSLSLRATQFGGACLTPDPSLLEQWILDVITSPPRTPQPRPQFRSSPPFRFHGLHSPFCFSHHGAGNDGAVSCV